VYVEATLAFIYQQDTNTLAQNCYYTHTERPMNAMALAVHTKHNY